MKKQEKQDREEKQKELMEKLEEGIKAVFTQLSCRSGAAAPLP